MIKPIQTATVVRLPNLTQIYNKNKMVNIAKKGKEITKTYIDTSSMKILKVIKDIIK